MTENNKKKSPNLGGKRPGSGRKKGTANVKTREIADKAIQEGTTPLEVMLKAMRGFVAFAEKMVAENNEVGALNAYTEAAKVAKDAAPYIHPRLAAIEHTGKDGESLAAMTPVINLTVGK